MVLLRHRLLQLDVGGGGVQHQAGVGIHQGPNGAKGFGNFAQIVSVKLIKVSLN